MTDITLYITDRKGEIHSLQAPTDMSLNLMEACKAADLPIDAFCGGMAMCATCQVYIESKHLLPGIGQDEEYMLHEANHVQPNSRLACQIPITAKLNGMRFRLAPE